MRTVAPPLITALLLLAARTAPAAVDDEQLQLDGSTGYACFMDQKRVHGLFGAAEVAYVYNAFWVLRGGYQISDHRGRAAFRIHQMDVGLRYQLDVFEYVPWLELSPAIYLSEGEELGPADFDAGFAAGLGFDWLLSPAWSLGASTRYHRLFGEDRFPALLTVGVRLGYRWVIGDPFAP